MCFFHPQMLSSLAPFVAELVAMGEYIGYGSYLLSANYSTSLSWIINEPTGSIFPQIETEEMLLRTK